MKKNSLTKEETILEVSKELFAKHGFDGASTRDICKKADVNISMISYYFGGKEGLYKKIISDIADKLIFNVLKNSELIDKELNLKEMNREEKVQLLLKIIDCFISFFYSSAITNAEIIIMLREQITSGTTINSAGYKIFKRIIASILNKEENDKEVVFRTISIAGQMNAARILTQFSLKELNQSGYTAEDVEMIKNIAINQTMAILDSLENN